MCVAAAIPLFGSVFSAFQGFQQAKTEKKIAERNAKLEEFRGKYEASQLDRKLRYTQGKAIVNASANGIGLDGSFLDIIADNEIQGIIDVKNAENNSINRAESIRAEGRAASARSKSRAVSVLIKGAGTFLRAA